MIDFIFETRQHLLAEHTAWYSREESKCGKARLEFSVNSGEAQEVTQELQETFAEFLKNIDLVALRISEEIQERFEKISRMKINPYDKLMQQMEENMAFMGKTMIGSAADKDASMQKIRENLMSAFPPKEKGNDNLSEDEFHRKTLVTASIAPYECSSLVYVYVITPHSYTAEDIILMNWHQGKFLSFDECQSLADEDFNSREGKEFYGIKFVNNNPVEATKVDIARFESDMGWKLPESYNDFLLKVNGGSPALAGKGRVPDFDCLNFESASDDYSNLHWRNFETDLEEYLKAGFFTFADAGEGFGGHSSIYLKPGKHYGKIFCWYWDDCLIPDEAMDSEINSMFFEEHIVADDFYGFIDYLKNQKEPKDDYDEDQVDVLEWLESSKENSISTMSHKESVEFIKKLFKMGVKKVFTDEYLDEGEDNIDDFEIKFPDDKNLRLDLEEWLAGENCLINKFEKTHWNVTSMDYDEEEFIGDNIETMLMLKFDFIDYEEAEDWELISDVVESMLKVSSMEKPDVEKEVIKIFREALRMEVDLNTNIRAYITY